jgi:hypothetical protein
MAYVYAMWREDFAAAHEHAVKVVDQLNGSALKPYRAFWEYLAAVAADSVHRVSGNEEWQRSFVGHVKSAASITGGVRWMASLAFAHPKIVPTEGMPLGADGIRDLLTEWGGLRGPAFEKRIDLAKKEIASKDPKTFHRGLDALGQMLGFSTKLYQKIDAAPDCVWYSEDGHFYVFEAKSNETADDGLSYDTLRQVGEHPTWLNAHDNSLPPPRITDLIIASPRTTLKKVAVPLARQVRIITLKEAAKLMDEASDLLRQIRAKARSLTDEQLLEHILDEYNRKGLSGDNLKKRIIGRLVNTLPVVD